MLQENKELNLYVHYDDFARFIFNLLYLIILYLKLQPFTGKYYNYTQDGVYHCVCCNADLFSSKTKYDSGSGWPSFYEAMKHAETDGSETGVLKRTDMSNGMVRTECICRNVSLLSYLYYSLEFIQFYEFSAYI